MEHKFFDQFTEQALDATLVPYETITSLSVDSQSDTNAQTQLLGGFPGTSGLDSFVVSLASITGLSSKMIPKSRFARVRAADWLDCIKTTPDPDLLQTTYLAKLNEFKQVDMELKLEHDLLLSADHEFVSQRLKESAKKVWELAALVPNCRPVNTKITLIPQAHEYKPSPDAEPRSHKVFDFGMKIPDCHEEIEQRQILDAKKQAYGMILKANAESKKLEQEILNADPTRGFDPSNYIDPTIASVFAEHEVYAFFQLRHIKIREARLKLVRQFNYFRSIEKRITLDVILIHVESSLNSRL